MHYTDEALLVSGDLEDSGRFYDRYVRALLAFFQRRTSDPEPADLTAQTFAAAMVARKRYEARTATAAAWLFTIAHNKLIDYQRRGSTEDRMRSRLGMEPVAVSAEDAEMIRWLGEEVASQMVEDLPPDQRDAIRAHVQLVLVGPDAAWHRSRLPDRLLRARPGRMPTGGDTGPRAPAAHGVLERLDGGSAKSARPPGPGCGLGRVPSWRSSR